MTRVYMYQAFNRRKSCGHAQGRPSELWALGKENSMGPTSDFTFLHHQNYSSRNRSKTFICVVNKLGTVCTSSACGLFESLTFYFPHMAQWVFFVFVSVSFLFFFLEYVSNRRVLCSFCHVFCLMKNHQLEAAKAETKSSWRSILLQAGRGDLNGCVHGLHSQ